MRRNLLLFGAALFAALHYALMPVDNRGRNSWLPVQWAIWVDYHDWWLNFAAFAILAGVIVFAMGVRRPAVYRMLVAVAAGSLLAIGIETAQLRIPGRTPDPADLHATLWGTMAGGAVAFLHRARRIRTSTMGSGTPARICFVDQTGQLGGAELMLLDLAEAFRDRCEVILLQDGPFRAALERRGVSCTIQALDGAAAAVVKDSGWRGSIQALPGLLRVVHQLKTRFRDVDLIYTNTAKALLAGGLAARWANRPLIHHLHDIVDAGHFSATNRWLLVQASNWGAERVIANSEATARAFVNAGGRVSLLSVIPNGFDPERFAAPDQAITDRQRAAWSGGGRTIFAVTGRLTPWKGQDVFLEALAQTPGAFGVIAGAALFTPEDQAFEDRLRCRAAEKDLAGRVAFLGFREDIAELMHAADVVVHCSTRAEPFGRVIVEAQLCGKPVIAAGAGGAAEIVEHRETGWLVRPGEVESLREAMAWMVSHPRERRELGSSGRDVAVKRYSLANVVQRTSAEVDEVAVKAGKKIFKFANQS
jgi:glycosyltransferase involved in cell wall biosynthesis